MAPACEIAILRTNVQLGSTIVLRIAIILASATGSAVGTAIHGGCHEPFWAHQPPTERPRCLLWIPDLVDIEVFRTAPFGSRTGPGFTSTVVRR